MSKILNVSRETIKKTVIFMFTLLLLINPINMKASDEIYLNADAYAIFDKDTGIIYLDENIEEVHGIASLTKLMSVYVFADEITNIGDLTRETMIPITDAAVDLSMNPDLSGVYFNYGDEYTLETILNLILVYSDNGATISLATFLFGSEEKAVNKMNEKAKNIGMNNTKFYNTTGLTMSDYGENQLNGTKPNDYNTSTVKDMAILTKNLLIDYPEILNIVNKSTIEFNGYTLHNFNQMLPEESAEYEGVVGLKTGTSIEAGACFIGYYISPKTNREYISIILGAETKMDRFYETAEMYNYVEDINYKEISPSEMSYNIEIRGSKEKVETLIPNETLYLKPDEKINAMKTDIIYNQEYFNDEGELQKDIPKDTEILEIKYQLINDTNKYLSIYQDEINEFSLIYKTDHIIEKENIIQETIRSYKDFLSKLYN